MNKELGKALLCLFLEVDESIANDVKVKAIRAITEAREEAYRAGYEEAAGVPEELENCLYEWLKEQK